MRYALPIVPVDEADFRIRDDGAHFNVQATSPAGEAWIATHYGDDLTVEGGIDVESRQMDAIEDAIEREGLRFGPHEGPPTIDTWPGESSD